MNGLMILDGDDTLWMNEWQYSKARANFFAFLYEEFGDLMPSIIILVPRYFEIDHSLFPIWGVKRGRVFIAMLKLYHELLDYFKEKLGANSERWNLILQKRPEHEKRIFELGEKPFDFYELKWVDGAKEVLDKSRNDGFTLCLITSYDKNVWIERGKYLEADKYFSRIKVTEGPKTQHDFRGIIGNENEYTVIYAVGNGETDIRPAIELSEKCHGIYIPHNSASPVFRNGENKNVTVHTHTPIDHPRVRTLRSIMEMLALDFQKCCPAHSS